MRRREEISIQPEWAESFRTIGLTDFDSFVEFEKGQVVSEVRDRVVWRYGDYDGTLNFFLKVYRKRGANRPANQLASLRNPRTLAEIEAKNLEWLEEKGFPAPRVLAWGGRLDGFTEEMSFLLTEEMRGMEPLDEWLESKRSELCAEDFREAKLRLIDGCAELLRELHDSGFHHPFPYLRHFFVPSEPLPLSPSPPHGEGELPPPRNAGRGLGGGVPSIGIIDVDSAKISASVSTTDRARGLAELFLSSFKSSLTQTDRLRFYRTYCGGEVDRGLATKVLKRFRQKLNRHPNRYAWVKEAVSRIPYPNALKDSISG